MRPRRPVPDAPGFTLVEMLVVVAVLALLAAAASPVAMVAEQRLKERELRSALREIRSALDQYKKAFDEGRIQRRPTDSGYPPSLTALVDGVADTRSPAADRRLYFLRRIPVDPFAPAGTPAASMWGLRSYASPANDPRPGDDVFDIHSLSHGTGSNGIAYREW